jgi:tetratricopeptide (TPR) repeat protein/tRNA A-37 threonylcarbamoyl transferase component Bud32
MPQPAPTPATADRNLLFGILAVQMDFVSRDQLIAAMNAWVLDKARPLGHILRDQRALDEDEHALLEALVRKHLHRHGDDPARSLAAVSSVGSVRQDLHQVADPDLQASLAHVPATRPPAEEAPPSADHAGEDDPHATRSYSVGTLTSAGQRFRILRPHAKGGLGIVFVAHDEELRREVALKEIQVRHADREDSRARFLLEAEITGGLEHPGIVPVYGLGTYGDGRPYYAMRFIRGDSLQEAIERFHRADVPGRDPGERALALRQLLGRFVDVCDAIAYAHSRGVLHRDLKPGNIMLGQYGETLVVDWGLAKAVGRAAGEGGAAEGLLQPASAGGAAATQMGSALGTPQFMSPEQAAGRLDQMGPASDVYSLGATLYCLLTGRAAMEGREVGAVLRQVQRGDFPPPRQVKREVPAALAAVCLKAMALRPEDRYATPRALAADVEKWLADEPVSAWREPWRMRAGRWARRHQAMVAACAAGLLVTVLAGGVGAWWLDRQRAEQRQAVETTLEKVGELQREARWKEAAALLERERTRLGPRGPADLRARVERAADELALVKRLEDIRLKRATLVEGHVDWAGADRDYAVEFRAAGLGEVGSDAARAAAWVRQTSVADALVAALDDWAACVGDRQRRSWVLEVVRQADPDPWRDGVRDPAAWDDADVLAQWVRQGRATQQSPQLLAVVGGRLGGPDAVELLKAAWERHPGDFWVNVKLGNALVEVKKPELAVGYYRAALAVRPGTAAVHTNLGGALHHQHKVEEAMAAFRTAIQLDPNYGLAHYNLGVALDNQHKVGDAILAYRKAIELDPKFAQAHYNLGIALSEQHKVEEAIAAYRKAIEIDPKDAQAHTNLGLALYEQDKVEEGIAAYRKAIEIDPKDAQAHYNLGIALRNQHKVEEAIAAYRKAIEINPNYAQAHYNLGLALYEQDKVEEGIAAYRKAIEIDPKLAQAHYNLGIALSEQHKVEEAVAAYRKAIEIDPKHAQAHTNLGLALYEQHKVEEAITEYRQAIELDPKLAQAHGALGQALLKQGAFSEARQANQRCLDLLPANHPLRALVFRLLRQCEQMQALDQKLAAVLQGKSRPAGAAEQAGLAGLCVIKKRYADATRFFTDAFADKPTLADDLQAGHRYNAARAAALAAAGQGADAATLDDKDRARLRQQALGWLRADLALWGRQAEGGTPQARALVQQTLRHWQEDPDLAGVRDAAALAKLSEAERADWKKLWADVEATLKKAGKK